MPARRTDEWRFRHSLRQVSVYEWQMDQVRTDKERHLGIGRIVSTEQQFSSVMNLAVHHLQSQHFLEWVEVAVAVQKLVSVKHAEGRDPAVNGFADGVSALA